MRKLKFILRKIVYGSKASGALYIEHLRKKGMTIGKDVIIYSPSHTIIDEQYPWMIEIGNHVRITQGVIMLTHDYSWSVLKRVSQNGDEGYVLGNSGKIVIGDNVFIGMNAIILGGVSIGNNVVIGAGSVITKSCDANSVYAGVPAKKIMSIEEYFEKRKNMQLEEAKNLAIEYRNKFHKIPPKSVFSEYFMLFSTEDSMESEYLKKLELCGNFEASYELIKKRHNQFESYEEFLKHCFKKSD